jgi:uncharacterized protein (TIGR02646 family)
MIKLDRHQKPEYLSDDKVKELTDDFKLNKTTVWNNDHIKKPLLSSSYGKCAYCECSLTAESNYMEVEHFEDKKNNPDKVVLWENLLPSCKRCNGSKSTHDVLAKPIVNPYDEDPREHIALRLYRLRGKTEKGNRTIDITNLNHSERLVMSRFKIGEKIHELVETSWDRYFIYVVKKDTRSKNRVIGIVEGLLKECQPKADYAASTATILLTDSKFVDLIKSMKAEVIWTQKLERYFQSALPVVLDYA